MVIFSKCIVILKFIAYHSLSICGLLCANYYMLIIIKLFHSCFNYIDNSESCYTIYDTDKFLKLALEMNILIGDSWISRGFETYILIGPLV